jgi:hypothetical protein
LQGFFVFKFYKLCNTWAHKEIYRNILYAELYIYRTYYNKVVFIFYIICYTQVTFSFSFFNMAPYSNCCLVYSDILIESLFFNNIINNRSGREIIIQDWTKIHYWLLRLYCVIVTVNFQLLKFWQYPLRTENVTLCLTKM